MENLVDTHYRMNQDVESNHTRPFEEPNTGNDKYNEYKRLASEKLYPSCEGPETTLSAIVELHNLNKQFGWWGNSVTALLSILKRWLPRENTLPEKYPYMKSMMKDLGMKAKFIHACSNNCILYWKKNEDKDQCPQCGEPRYAINMRKGSRLYKEPKSSKTFSSNS